MKRGPVTKTIMRLGCVLAVEIRTARKRHACNDCPEPIERGEKYERTAFPPHSADEWDVDRWLVWRTHYPRWEGDRFLLGCALAAAYREKASREATP